VFVKATEHQVSAYNQVLAGRNSAINNNDIDDGVLGNHTTNAYLL